MKISGKEFLNTINQYFNQADYDTSFYWLFFSAILFLVILYIYINRGQAYKDPFEDIPEKDMELLKQISAQKGLSSFDRDFLIMQALTFYIKPAKILLDRETFEKVEKKMEDNNKKTGEPIGSDENIRNMKRLKAKLFF